MIAQPMTRGELIDRIAEVNADAKKISRHGLGATRDNETYDDLHANLDFLVTCILAQQIN